MSDLDAIRARHGPTDCDDDEEAWCCEGCRNTWPCDTAIVLAALDAALARERRLREAAQRVSDYWPEPSGGLTTGEHEQVVAMAALLAALAALEEAT